MTIPGRGDLAPRRRSSYGRQRRWPRVLLTLILLAGLGAGAYYGWQRWHDEDTATVASGSRCPTPSAAPSASPTSAHVTAKVLNGSLKPGLAKRVAKTLHQRFGVVVPNVGNARRFTRGVSLVRYPPRLAVPARALAGYVVPRARLKAETHAGRVELDIGTRFRSVAPKLLRTTPLPSVSPSPCRSS